MRIYGAILEPVFSVVWMTLGRLRLFLSNVSHPFRRAASISTTATATRAIRTMGVLSNFLVQTKTEFLRDLQSKNVERWTVVMGNEAGGSFTLSSIVVGRSRTIALTLPLDLDTIACSVAYSYLSSKHHNQPTIALVQTPRTDLYLRPENLYAFSLAHLTSNQQELLCIDDIPSSDPQLSQVITKFALVDHNQLSDQFGGGPGKVVGIIDHHADERSHLDAEIREIVNPVGSCASLVTKHFRGVWDASVPPELATLLLSAIYIDTSGLKPDDKAVEIDEQSAEFLTPRSTFNVDGQSLDVGIAPPPPPPLNQLADDLSDLKKDVSHFTTRDLLRRDFKDFVFGGLRTGLSTIPVGLDDCIKRDGTTGFWKALDDYMDEKGLAILGFLTSYKAHTKPKHRREILLLLKESVVPVEVEKRLFEGMEADLQLRLEPKFEMEVADGRHAQVWNQGNTDASRKYTAPLIRQLIEGGGSTGEQTSEE